MNKETIRFFKGSRNSGASKFVRLPEQSYGCRRTGNMIVQGDNLDALKALGPVAAGQIRCIYIDPPYNNQERYTHYSDDLSHEVWLESITSRLAYFTELLTEDGSIWISIDDREVHYLKVAADKILKRERFVTSVIWEQRTTRENRRAFSNNHEYLLVYAKNPVLFRETRNRLEFTSEARSRYKNPDNDPRGPWQSVSANVQDGHATPAQFYEVVAPNGRRHAPPKGRCWVYTVERMNEEIRNNNIWFGKDGNGVPRRKVFLHNGGDGLTPPTLWLASEVGTSKSAKKHLLRMFPHEPVFDTPKPEQLIHRVLDAYLGSGTTAAVAHKMGRRYIGIERGAHAITYCAHRLRLVIDGEAGGVSGLVGWKGGGGFDFFKLRDSADAVVIREFRRRGANSERERRMDTTAEASRGAL
jgi:adenine-specific DNA-methyltransferase